MFGLSVLFAVGLLGVLGSCRTGSVSLAPASAPNSDEMVPASLQASRLAPGFADREGERENTRTEPEPIYEPAVVSELLARSANQADARAQLGLRLAVLDSAPDLPWHLALVNRGTSVLRVVFDLRTLSLEVEPPRPEPTPVQRGTRAAKPAKRTVCMLPKSVVPAREAQELELELAPGEGVVHAFDPRLYCSPTELASPFVPGSRVTVRLGFPEKTKTVWRKGKAEKKRLEQTAPFVARLAETEEPTPVAPIKLPQSAGDSEELAFERFAVKQLVSESLELGSEYGPRAIEDEARKPLALRLTRGSDARTEREAIVTMQLVNQSSRPLTVYFRRELVSFELSGPAGITSCDAGPDERAPERQSFLTIAPGAKLSAASRLIELCPSETLRMPGLYRVHGRFEALEKGADFGLDAFQGMIVSQKPALVRVQTGWGDLVQQKQLLRVRVGGARAEAGNSDR